MDRLDPAWDALMRRACELAARGAGRARPNPLVGCVVLDAGGAVVGEGWHAGAGGPHAEVVALREAGSLARGGTAVVTLEPCRHTGRTGPCTDALIEAGIARVVVGVADPTAAAGGGAEELRAAGVEVVDRVATAEAEHVNRAWLTTMRTGRPHVTLKTATTLDGRVAAADGTSRWVTGPAARADVHGLRSRSDAVLVGGGTLRTDDPHLAVRTAGADHRPLRVALDSAATITPGARILDDAAPTLVVVADDAPQARVAALRDLGVEVLAVPRTPAGLDLASLLQHLAERGVRALLVEGGPTVAASFVAGGLVDELVAYLAPSLLGAGPAALGDIGITTIAGAVRLHIFDVAQFGDDVRISARVHRERS